MEEICEFFEKCPIARYFKATGWTMFASRYCRDGYSAECARQKLRQANQPVPDHLLPWDHKLVGS